MMINVIFWMVESVHYHTAITRCKRKSSWKNDSWSWLDLSDEETNVHFAEFTMEQSPISTQHTQLLEPRLPPDPGFNQREHSEVEIEEDFIIFENLTEQESEGELDICRFIDNKVVETTISQSFWCTILFALVNSPCRKHVNTKTENCSAGTIYKRLEKTWENPWAGLQ